MSTVYVETPKGKKKAGVLKGDTFFKHVKKSKHLLRKFNAWGIDSRVLAALQSQGCKNVVVHDTESRIIYSVSLEVYNRVGFDRDLGHGHQTFAALAYFKQQTEDEKNEQTANRKDGDGPEERSPGRAEKCDICGV